MVHTSLLLARLWCLMWETFCYSRYDAIQSNSEYVWDRDISSLVGQWYYYMRQIQSGCRRLFSLCKRRVVVSPYWIPDPILSGSSSPNGKDINVCLTKENTILFTAWEMARQFYSCTCHCYTIQAKVRQSKRLCCTAYAKADVTQKW
jgi:hypothetical protein